MEDPILRRRDRTPTITVRGDIAEGLQPPDVSTAVWKELQPIIAKLPAGYRIEEGGSIEESGKANRALAPLFPIMIALKIKPAAKGEPAAPEIRTEPVPA